MLGHEQVVASGDAGAAGGDEPGSQQQPTHVA
jgi:hypothetical protein